MNEAEQIIELATSINNVLEAERKTWRSKLVDEQKERDKMREGWQAEKERTTKLDNAMEHIIEYWNRDENPGAMSDALWHILETAEQARKE